MVIIMKIDRKAVENIFSQYVSAYNLEDEKIRLKYEHTFRVAGLCARIAESEEMSTQDVDLAWVCGMLHDIGRFEQVRRYHTFADAESVDHAYLGTEVLFADKKIFDFFPDIVQGECDFIKELIICHSAYRIPDDYDERTATFSNILRDADKIDILKVNCDFALEDIYNVTTQELMQDEVTKEVMDSFYEKHAVLRKLKKTSVDHIVGHISLTYELVYPESLKILKEQGYLWKLMNFTSQNENTNRQFQNIRGFMQKYLDEQIGLN